MTKHPFIYEAIKEAFDDFKQREGYNPADMVVDELGFRGPNKKQQLYNHLSPYSEKYLKLDHFIIILKNLLDSAHIPLRSLANEFGYELTPMGQAHRCEIVQLVLQTNLKLEIELAEFAKEVMRSIEDGEISYEEALSLKKEINRFRKILDELDAALTKEMR